MRNPLTVYRARTLAGSHPPARPRRLARLGLATLLLSSAIAHAQSYRDVSPTPPPASPRPSTPPPPPEPASGSAEVAVTALRGLVFEASASKSASTSASTNAEARAADGRIVARGLTPIDDAFLQGFAADLDRPLTFARLADIRRAVVARYREAGLPLVDVYVPEQDVTDGVVRIAVASYRLGRVIPRGNRYFSDALLTGDMPLTAGDAIRESDVATGLALLNANPYRAVDVIYAPGEADGTTDVILQTADRFPMRVSAGYDNAGVPQLGRDRFFAGIDYGNLFGLDQQIAYQITASNDALSGNPDIEGRPNRARFVAHALNYSAPLPWHDRVELFGVYAQSTPRLPDSYGQTGISAQASIRYDWRLTPFAGWQQQAQFGYDFKRSNNNLEFGGFQVFNSNTHIHQFVLAYELSRTDTSGQTRANATVVLSPGRLDADNNEAAFESARHGATPRYMYAQLSAQRDIALGGGFIASGRAMLQWTPDTLLPSEEMGLGGDSSVRGYLPYVVQGDRGWNVQTEVRTPPWSMGASGVAIQPFLFVDAGRVWNRIDQPAEPNNGSLVGIGGGFRFQVSRFINVRGTFGFPLHAAEPAGSKAPVGMLYIVLGS
ncbi:MULTISPECIES: ShlB/FhaC/HecB family hemolysin secretion/activation protein [unclassified Caballeronia]|uniref:ShlB/FhaC/HecB family hemolysin secretion/activation protein n=1 Tax=unclassified Caballeronia TaxID=2646786 RepID=UPI0028645BD9|nr:MULTISPECIES: ShlB/FhaC/HecB family hemolysin secretion/activation protein [unclassified Caballeronia]MDR5740953.1 ShlB/FhaC/HecB family hemolysin secretion/activation protein [Caballeronia sp. LZ016]MDR5806851.1 ShlB/FhaC/HecB family hemolysin secretion/activation protein [Caballeronia sp. LZ019]